MTKQGLIEESQLQELAFYRWSLVVATTSLAQASYMFEAGDSLLLTNLAVAVTLLLVLGALEVYRS